MNHNRDMPHYIVEIRLAGANARLDRVARVVTASVGRNDGRLVCTVEAPMPKPFAI